MEKDNIVSLWLGIVNSKESLYDLLKISYIDDESPVPSKFAQLFSIDRYDDDTREADFISEPLTSYNRLLEGFSYDDVIIPRFSNFKTEKSLIEYNSIVLLYNYEYTQKNKTVNLPNCYFEFIASVGYR